MKIIKILPLTIVALLNFSLNSVLANYDIPVEYKNITDSTVSFSIHLETVPADVKRITVHPHSRIEIRFQGEDDSSNEVFQWFHPRYKEDLIAITDVVVDNIVGDFQYTPSGVYTNETNIWKPSTESFEGDILKPSNMIRNTQNLTFPGLSPENLNVFVIHSIKGIQMQQPVMLLALHDVMQE